MTAEVAELRSRGVEIIEYDTPDLKTRDGVAEVSHAWVAWFTDPGNNSLPNIQYR